MTQAEDVPRAQDSDALAFLPAWRLRELIRDGAASPVGLVRSCLDRIAALEPSIHAFITVMADQALAEAASAERAAASGERTGPLHGIPVVLKDDVWVKDVPCTAGSRVLEGFVPSEDSIVAERLRAAGAIILGKTNLPEFAGFIRSVSLVAEDCRNPWDRSRTSGGSSGGSAASVAAGMVPIAIGTDGGGSIRLPAALCGVVGLLPSKGLVPSYGSVTYGHCFSGPITRDVRDAATLLQVLAGSDERDPWAQRWAPQTDGPIDYLAGLDDGVTGMRLAWSSDLGFVRPRDPRVVDVTHEAAEVLAGLGASLDEPQDAAIGDIAGRAYSIARQGAAAHDEGPVLYLQSPEWAALMRDPANQALLCPYDQESGRRVAPGAALSYAQAIAARERVAEQFQKLFSRYDVLLTPTIGETAPPITDELVWPFTATYYTAYTNAANFCGLPGISVPAGMVDGVPVGIHILGRAGAEATLLRVARALELARPWPHPPI